MLILIPYTLQSPHVSRIDSMEYKIFSVFYVVAE